MTNQRDNDRQAATKKPNGFEITDDMVRAVAQKLSDSGIVMPEFDDPNSDLLLRTATHLLRRARLETFGKETN